MPEALVLVLFEHGAKFLDLAGAFVEAGAQPIPDHLFLFGPWTFDDDLASWQRIQFFVGVLCEVFPPAYRDKEQAPQPSPEARARGQVAYRLLAGMHTIPGGAANFSASGLKRQDNDLIVIESPGAAASFKRNFEARYASGG